MSEAYVSTQQPEEGEEARLPSPDVDPSRSSRAQSATSQGPRPPVRLIWRIQRRDTFLALRSGRRGRSGPLAVSWVPGDPVEPARVAFAIGRKVGNAVIRNRLRRQLRTLLREVVPVLPAGAWLVGATPGAADLDYDQLGRSLTGAIAKVLAAQTQARPSSPPIGMRR
jgi:ribonuclease P protein component